MKEKEKIRLNITLIVVCVCVLSFSLLWASYGYFFKLDDNETTNNLLVEYLDKNNNTISTHNVPMAFDANEVKNSEVVYVQNSDSSNSKKIMFTIASDPYSLRLQKNFKETDTLIPSKYIDAIVYKFNEKNNQLSPVTDVINLGKATINDSSSDNTEYILFTDTLGPSSSLDNANTYTIFMWLDENAPESYYESYLSLKVNVREK